MRGRLQYWRLACKTGGSREVRRIRPDRLPRQVYVKQLSLKGFQHAPSMGLQQTCRPTLQCWATNLMQPSAGAPCKPVPGNPLSRIGGRLPKLGWPESMPHSANFSFVGIYCGKPESKAIWALHMHFSWQVGQGAHLARREGGVREGHTGC